VLFLKLLTAHLLGDYIFQTDRVASGKHRLPYMVWHALAHGTLLALVGLTETWTAGLWGVLSMILAAHVAIDAWTSRRVKRDWKLLLLDQSLHAATLVAGVALLRPEELTAALGLAAALTKRPDVYVVVSGAVIAIWAGAIAVGRWVEPFAAQLGTQRPGLARAGRMIGLIERALIFLAVILRLEALVGFVIAAKAILRLPEVREPSHRELAEYYLVGSLASVFWAVLAGVLVRWGISGRP
jgi:uncharacterized protein DUF3307